MISWIVGMVIGIVISGLVILNLRKELFYLYKKCGGFHD